MYITCEKSGGLHLAEPGLMVGSCSLANKIWARLEILKARCRFKYSIFHFASQDTALFQQPKWILIVFLGKHYYKIFL